MKAAIMQVFFWPVFEGEFYNANIHYHAFSPIRIGDVLLEASRNLIDINNVKKQLPTDRYLQRTSRFEQVLSTMDLNQEESFLASRFEGQDITVNTLHLMSGLPEEKIYRFVFALEKLGAIHLLTSEEKQRLTKKPERMVAVGDSRATLTDAKTTTPVGATAAGASSDIVSARRAAGEREKLSDSSAAVKRLKEDYLKQLMARRFVEPPNHHIKVADQFYKLAQEKFVELDYWKVTQLCKQALKHNPGESKYYHLMATAYARHPRFGKDAEQCFYKAIEMDPWNPDYHVDFASFFRDQGLPIRALTQCEKALKIAPHHPKASELYNELKTRQR
jgi:tetratricopeptide (TPR) repeat protein